MVPEWEGECLPSHAAAAARSCRSACAAIRRLSDASLRVLHADERCQQRVVSCH
ncbi:hypothetical protein XCR_3362 [Xanthomonas campestris pv. raphani 756C]|nr:hypothetical protein XCR_3362 [Xanthomonas campestris pv. raphani 756C]